MPEKTINLEKLIFDYKLIEKSDDKGELFHLIRYAMKEACRQTLELAAENAKINWIENEVKMESDSDFAFRDSDGNWCKISLDEQSILNIINEVEL